MTPFEIVVAGRLIEQGYEVHTSGWPDFCCVKWDGDTPTVLFVEVKSNSDEVRENQKKMHVIFKALGIPVQVIHEDPDRKMMPLMASLPEVRKVGRPDDAFQRAMVWLKDYLGDGHPHPVRVVRSDAKFVENISAETLDRAYAEIGGVRAFKTGPNWFWRLPLATEAESESELIDIGDENEPK